MRERRVAGTDIGENDGATRTAQTGAADVERRRGERTKYTVLLIAACPFPANNGTSSRILRMGETLAERGHDVHVVTYHLCDDDIPIRDELTIHRVDPSFEYCKMDPGPALKKPLIDALLLKKAWEIAGTEPVDVIHAHHIEGLACALPVATVHDVPTIYDAHTHVTGELEEYYDVTQFDLVNSLIETVEKVLCRQANGTIAVSERLESVLSSYGVEDDSVWVVPTGINTDTVRKLAVESTLSRSDLGLDEDQPVVVYSGTLKPFQGLENLFAAMRRVTDRHPDARLLLVGGGDLNRYSEMARRYGVRDSVVFCGDVPFVEVPGYLSIADVGVLPRTEATGMPQKLTNYMTVGLPVVAFEGSGKALSHGENGLLVEDDAVESFAAGISKLVRNPGLREKMASAARQSVADYEWSSLIPTVEDAYSEILQ